ncbi:MAG: hypothetical protein NVV74_17980 [Magnetospirillum sp.]|nr:hypothetical protein [Magnetospirillum sp.]
MNDRRNLRCLTALVQLSMPGARVSEHDARHAVDHALSCDRTIRCSQRLECAWMACELADRLRCGRC